MQCEQLKLKVLIHINGNGTPSFTEPISRERVTVIAIPKMLDTRIFDTDDCNGSSKEVPRSVQYFNQLCSSASSHERLAVIELFGHNFGGTSRLAA